MDALDKQGRVFNKKRLVIHLGIAFDRNYLNPFYALVASVFETNQQHNITVHAIASGISGEEKNAIISYFNLNKAAINFYEVDEKLVQQFVLTGKWTSAVYYRLLFPHLVQADVQRLLYLDTDTLVINDLQELYQLDLEEYPVGAVYDIYVKKAPQLGINEEENYFNSGVLLIDISRWKEQRISEQAFDYLVSYPERILFVDQDALNAVLINNWKHLPFRFNTLYSYLPQNMSAKEGREFMKDKVILHFTLERPWKMLCKNPYRYLYHKFLRTSRFRSASKYDDYAVTKLPALFKIKLVEAYHNFPLLQTVWRGLKSRLA